MKKCSPSKSPVKLGPTCLVMTEVLKRDGDKGTGIVCEQWIDLSKGTMTPTILYRGRKRGDKIFILSVCPWCGGDILPHGLKAKRAK